MTVKRVIAALSIFLVWSCVQNPAGNVSAPAESFADVYAEAEAALATAAAKRNVWSKTEGLLHQSRAAFDDGREQEAIKLAHEAKLQAELALEQAVSQEADWRSNIYPQ